MTTEEKTPITRTTSRRLAKGLAIDWRGVL
jgi:hypothetical protein